MRNGGENRLTGPRAPPIIALGALLFVVLASTLGWSIPLNNDVSWQYWAVRQLRAGTLLYRDLGEMNLPLWYWEAIPVSALSDMLKIDADHLVVVATMARATLALVLVALLLRSDERAATGRILFGLALILCVLPLHDFAEREHLMLFGALPYSVLIACRMEGRAASRSLALMVGAFAAFAFALKPHFALVPIALELWLGLRRGWRLIRPETLVLGGGAMLYAIAVAVFTPHYFTDALPFAMMAYGAFSPPFSALFMRQAWAISWVLAVPALAIAWRHLPARAQAVGITALALALSYLLQGKGFPYHAMAVSAALGWALWLALADNGSLLGNMAGRPLAVLALGAIGTTVAMLGVFTPSKVGRVTAAAERLPPGSTFAVISAHSWHAFPLVEKGRFVWPSREISLWMLPMIAREGEGPAATARGLAVRRRTLNRLASDLWCHPPDAILFDDPGLSPALEGFPFDYLAFARSDPRIAELLGHYRMAVADKGAALYIRQIALLPRGKSCRPIPIRPDYR